MKIRFQTKVKGNYKDVMAAFDQKLFEALKPRMTEMEIVEFTGSKKGDRVHIRVISPLKAEWISIITEDGEDQEKAYFVDEGVKLPFPLTFWRHNHLVQKITEDSSYIVDDITFKGKNAFLTCLLYPAIYLGFAPRKKIYQQYFGI